MIRSLAVALLAALAASAAAALALGGDAGPETFVLLPPLGLLAVAAGHVLVARRAALGGLRRQFSALALLVVAQAAIVVAVFVVRMFVSGHDAFLTAMLVGWAATLGLWVAYLLAARAMGDVEAIRETLAAVAVGRRDVRTGVGGRGELAELAADVDATIARLDGEERAAARWWPPSRTTSARRSRRCACSARRSRTASSTARPPRSTSPGWPPTCACSAS